MIEIKNLVVQIEDKVLHQLLTEFAVWTQKLISISLEGSVGR